MKRRIADVALTIGKTPSLSPFPFQVSLLKAKHIDCFHLKSQIVILHLNWMWNVSQMQMMRFHIIELIFQKTCSDYDEQTLCRSALVALESGHAQGPGMLDTPSGGDFSHGAKLDHPLNIPHLLIRRR